MLSIWLIFVTFVVLCVLRTRLLPGSVPQPFQPPAPVIDSPVPDFITNHSLQDTGILRCLLNPTTDDVTLSRALQSLISVVPDAEFKSVLHRLMTDSNSIYLTTRLVCLLQDHPQVALSSFKYLIEQCQLNSMAEFTVGVLVPLLYNLYHAHLDGVRISTSQYLPDLVDIIRPHYNPVPLCKVSEIAADFISEIVAEQSGLTDQVTFSDMVRDVMPSHTGLVDMIAELHPDLVKGNFADIAEQLGQYHSEELRGNTQLLSSLLRHGIPIDLSDLDLDYTPDLVRIMPYLTYIGDCLPEFIAYLLIESEFDAVLELMRDPAVIWRLTISHPGLLVELAQDAVTSARWDVQEFLHRAGRRHEIEERILSGAVTIGQWRTVIPQNILIAICAVYWWACTTMFEDSLQNAYRL